ncbi:FUSC family protein [Mycobacterium szulgai]|uniref:Integral membrane bound transporter domain-containing protein n=1 Tax=Mycobacterium szulgai TaxID=1787 RepID=A0A1X2EHE7_MYCSZ|nr:FUSC family protein [Mycobacterium szulgai]MCV7078341.1 aromatic acid exporter family protein [Mycobacterium szulgai]ORX02023.1 hypothetical protein AWC27_01700 [Mycobacterium szulgai]
MTALLSEAVQRVRSVLWPITQTSVAAALAWYVTHDALHHRQPFFAPISAVVCMSATNVLRSRRAMQMIIGVALGIVLGAGVHEIFGAGAIAMAVAVFVALGFSVLIGRGFIAQGLMFVNQTAVSSVLVLVFAPTGGVVAERLFDALIGGGLALLFAMLLFPADPVALLCRAREAVLAGLHDTLVEVATVVQDPSRASADWPLSAFDRLHNQLGALIEARQTAHLVARRAPRRWVVRDTIREVDQQSARLGMLVSCVLHLARAVTRPDGGRVPQLVQVALVDLADGIAIADEDPAAALAHAAAARSRAVELESHARDRSEMVLADIVCAGADDLQRVIELPARKHSRRLL